MTTITEANLEDAALAWLMDLGWGVEHGPGIAPDTPSAEHVDFRAVVLERRLRGALARLNPGLPASAFDDALRKLTHPEGSTLEARNRAFHRMLVDGVTVGYRVEDGTLRWEQARVVDFDHPTDNDWLAVNRFTVTENLPAATGAAQAGRNIRRPDVVLFVNGLPRGVIELKTLSPPPPPS